MKYLFSIHYKTQFGEQIRMQTFVNGEKFKMYQLTYDNDFWILELDAPPIFDTYYYQYYDENTGKIKKEAGHRIIQKLPFHEEVFVHDQWKNTHFPENYLIKPFFQETQKAYSQIAIEKSTTYLVSIQMYAPEGEKVVMSGNTDELGNWNLAHTLEMQEVRNGFWQIALNSYANGHSIQFKFGLKKGDSIQLEEGESRTMSSCSFDGFLQVYNEQNFRYSLNQMPKMAGLAVPVFSIRTEDSMGIGEFMDFMKLGDWMEQIEMKVLQILPINDSIAYHNWNDCYPYAAISVYALNPFYISIQHLSVPLSASEKKQIRKDSQRLNLFEKVALEKVMKKKWEWLRMLYGKHFEEIKNASLVQDFISKNKNWLYSYCVFCVLRDHYKTPDFSKWKTLSTYDDEKVNAYFLPTHKHFREVFFYAWVQFELDRQLQESIEYLHRKNIKIKGDLPIGINRMSVEAWKEPKLFGLDFQAGAPPDDFSKLGQNWEFPTYNWETMQENGLLWWKSRFQALNKYFDAIRIDHILGFFRIWRIPQSATQGVMGYFYPSIPVTEDEFKNRGIPFQFERYCTPYITDEILENLLQDQATSLAAFFLNKEGGVYHFKEEYNSQRKIEAFLKNRKEFRPYKEELLYLLSNLLFIPEKREEQTVFHPRFELYNLPTFQYLPKLQQHQLLVLYNDYFYLRQDGIWQQSAMEKLPYLLEASDMLIAGEDLGMVPRIVPEVMKELAILSLQVQRMTNDEKTYKDPTYAPYLSVVTTGTHDTSTLRQWWEENEETTQYYYNHQLGRQGEAPKKLNSSLMQQIIEQHLHSPAMLVIVPIQEWLSIEKETSHPNQEEERINIPGVYPHKWQYRMHLSVEELEKEKNLNQKIKSMIDESKRA